MDTYSAAAPVARLDTEPSPDALMQLGLGFWGSKTMLSAVELGVFSALAEGPAEAGELAARLGVHPRAARDFFDTLVALKLLDRSDGRYRNSPATDLYLDRRKPSYLGGLLEMANSRLYATWGSLTDCLRTGRSQSKSHDHGDPFEALYESPEALTQFLRAMTAHSLPAARAIAQQFPWEDYETFADIGCAEGGLPVTVAAAHPHLTGWGYDLPAVGPLFTAYAAEHGLAERLDFQPGNFFTDPLPAAQVLVFGHILHDWDLEQKRLLLRKAYEALPPGGAVLVYDSMIDDDRRENLFGLLMSLNMLVETPGGFDYTGADCLAWLAETGFRDGRVEPLVGGHSMAIGLK
ncbi:MAG: methyltransferase [Armatimonadetes bacterium]|nr:methyltransferase [Armatimonadota bacterium]